MTTHFSAVEARPSPHRFPAARDCLQSLQDESGDNGWDVAPPVLAANHDSLRILIVNDDMRSASTLKDTLCALGYSATLVAYSGKRALAAVTAYSPAVAIVDLELGDMTGYRLARMMQDHSDRQVRGLPLIAVAERYEFATINLVRAAGFVGMVTKPVPPWMLSGLLLRSCP
ncbi:MAG: response regulator [Gammaproteobacteria bacterium]